MQPQEIPHLFLAMLMATPTARAPVLCTCRWVLAELRGSHSVVPEARCGRVTLELNPSS